MHYQEKMRGQRGRLPVQPLGYVMSTKVIFRRVEVFRDVSMQVNLGLMFERKAKISCNGGRSGLDVCACGRLGRQTSARTKTFARLKITFVNMTYPGQRPEPPSLGITYIFAAGVRARSKKSFLYYKLRPRLSRDLRGCRHATDHGLHRRQLQQSL